MLVETMVQPAIPEIQWAANFRSKKDSEYKPLSRTSYQTIRNTLIRWASKGTINLYLAEAGYRRRYSVRDPEFNFAWGSHIAPSLEAKLEGTELCLSAVGFDVSVSLNEGPVWNCNLGSFETEILRDEEYDRFYVIFDTKLLGVVKIEWGRVSVSLPGFVYGGEPEYARAMRLYLRNHREGTLLAVEGLERMTKVKLAG